MTTNQSPAPTDDQGKAPVGAGQADRLREAAAVLRESFPETWLTEELEPSAYDLAVAAWLEHVAGICEEAGDGPLRIFAIGLAEPALAVATAVLATPTT